MSDLTKADFNVVQEYINTGTSKALDPDHQHMLDICVFCYGLLRDFPQRNVAIAKLMRAKNMPRTTATEYVDFTRKTWGNFLDYKRDFLETFFIEKLMEEITSPSASEAVRAKNLATLQKHLENMPDKGIDPHLTESNTVNIQVNMANNTFVLPEKVLATLPVEVRQQIMNSFDYRVDDAGAEALLEN